MKDIDIIDVDESQQTVTLLMKVRMAWSDDRIDVNRSQSDKDKYVFVEANINTVKSRAVDLSTIQRSKVQGQRSQYIRIKFPLHKESENLRACY